MAVPKPAPSEERPNLTEAEREKEQKRIARLMQECRGVSRVQYRWREQRESKQTAQKSGTLKTTELADSNREIPSDSRAVSIEVKPVLIASPLAKGLTLEHRLALRHCSHNLRRLYARTQRIARIFNLRKEIQQSTLPEDRAVLAWLRPDRCSRNDDNEVVNEHGRPLGADELAKILKSDLRHHGLFRAEVRSGQGFNFGKEGKIGFIWNGKERSWYASYFGVSRLRVNHRTLTSSECTSEEGSRNLSTFTIIEFGDRTLLFWSSPAAVDYKPARPLVPASLWGHPSAVGFEFLKQQPEEQTLHGEWCWDSFSTLGVARNAASAKSVETRDEDDPCSYLARRLEDWRAQRVHSFEGSTDGVYDNDIARGWLEDWQIHNGIAAITEGIYEDAKHSFSMITRNIATSAAIRSTPLNDNGAAKVIRPRCELLLPWIQFFVDGKGRLKKDNAHVVLFAVRYEDGKDGEDPNTILSYYDSSPRTLTNAAKQEMFENVKAVVRNSLWIGSGPNTPDCRIQEQVETTTVTLQRNVWAAGHMTILNAWVRAFGLTRRKITVNAAFYDQAIEVINLATAGFMDSATIHAFFRCWKFVEPGDIPANRIVRYSYFLPDEYALSQRMAEVQAREAMGSSGPPSPQIVPSGLPQTRESTDAPGPPSLQIVPSGLPLRSDDNGDSSGIPSSPPSTPSTEDSSEERPVRFQMVPLPRTSSVQQVAPVRPSSPPLPSPAPPVPQEGSGQHDVLVESLSPPPPAAPAAPAAADELDEPLELTSPAEDFPRGNDPRGNDPKEDGGSSDKSKGKKRSLEDQSNDDNQGGIPSPPKKPRTTVLPADRDPCDYFRERLNEWKTQAVAAGYDVEDVMTFKKGQAKAKRDEGHWPEDGFAIDVRAQQEDIIRAISAVTEGIFDSTGYAFALLSAGVVAAARFGAVPDHAERIVRPRRDLLIPWMEDWELSNGKTGKSYKVTAEHNRHTVLFIFKYEPATGAKMDQVSVTYCDSSPGVYSDVEKDQITGWVKENVVNARWYAYPDRNFSVDQVPWKRYVKEKCTLQTNGWACGHMTVLNAWLYALGLTRNPDMIVPQDFYKPALEIMNLAMHGFMDSATIHAFFRCYGAVREGEVPEERRFDRTHAFHKNDDLTDYLAEQRELEITIRWQVPPRAEMAEIIQMYGGDEYRPTMHIEEVVTLYASIVDEQAAFAFAAADAVAAARPATPPPPPGTHQAGEASPGDSSSSSDNDSPNTKLKRAMAKASPKSPSLMRLILRNYKVDVAGLSDAEVAEVYRRCKPSILSSLKYSPKSSRPADTDENGDDETSPTGGAPAVGLGIRGLPPM
ncbi:hypothetical protein LTR66_009937 [Elasticomyces elasticus]|nr:hypothetical protein LTR66_009937 [Elasticomyces elasticus]